MKKSISRIVFFFDNFIRVQFSVTKAKVQKVDEHTNEIVAINNRNGNRDKDRENRLKKKKKKKEAENGTAKGWFYNVWWTIEQLNDYMRVESAKADENILHTFR